MSDEEITVEIDRNTANALCRLHEMTGLSTDIEDLDLDQIIFELIEEGFDKNVKLLKQTHREPILADDEESSAVPRFRDNRADFSRL